MTETISAPLRALAEAVSWCGAQPLTSEAMESAQAIRRRKLVEEASDILSRRPAYESKRWKHAMDMLKEADPDSLAPLEHQLRSPGLRPAGQIGAVITEEERAFIISGVVSARSRLASIRETDSTGRWKELGKLLIYVPSENVADGSSKYASLGFFDIYDAPPWDSWVHYSGKELICWVPTALIPLAQKGIDANPVQCIRWADSNLAIDVIFR